MAVLFLIHPALSLNLCLSVSLSPSLFLPSLFPSPSSSPTMLLCWPPETLLAQPPTHYIYKILSSSNKHVSGISQNSTSEYWCQVHHFYYWLWFNAWTKLVLYNKAHGCMPCTENLKSFSCRRVCMAFSTLLFPHLIHPPEPSRASRCG